MNFRNMPGLHYPYRQYLSLLSQLTEKITHHPAAFFSEDSRFNLRLMVEFLPLKDIQDRACTSRFRIHCLDNDLYVGFAKIEKRQKQLRLYFHVKTNDEALTYKIYFYRFRHGTMEGILLDSFQRNDTIIEFKNTYPLVVDLDQVDGFLIYHSNSHFFGSEWDDKPITIRNFLPTEDMAEKPEAVQAEENIEPEAPVLETQEPPEPAQGESLPGPTPAVTEPSEPAPEESIPESGPVQNPAPSDKEVPEEDEEEPPSGAPDPPPIEDPFDELPQEIPIPAGTPDTKSTVPEPAPEPAGLPPRVYVEPEIPESEPMSAESLTEEDTSEEEPEAVLKPRNRRNLLREKSSRRTVRTCPLSPALCRILLHQTKKFQRKMKKNRRNLLREKVFLIEDPEPSNLRRKVYLSPACAESCSIRQRSSRGR